MTRSGSSSSGAVGLRRPRRPGRAPSARRASPRRARGRRRARRRGRTGLRPPARRRRSPRSAALDLAARDDVVAAVGPAHPGLVAAVVVGRPEHERGLARSQTRQGSSPSSSRPRQSRTNALLSHSSPIVVGSVWPGCTRVSGGSFISTSMIEFLRSAKLVEPGARTPPTEPLKSVSPVNTSSPLTTKLSIPAVCPGVCSVSMCRPPTSSVSPGSIVRSTRRSSSRLERVGEHLDVAAPRRRASATWSWWWWVSSSVRDVHAEPLGRLQQRARRGRRSRSRAPCRPPRRRRGRCSTASRRSWSAR